MNTYRTITMYGEIKEQQAIDSKYLYNISKWEIRSEYRWRNPQYKNFRNQAIICVNVDTAKVVWVMFLGKDDTFRLFTRDDFNEETVSLITKTVCSLGEWSEDFIKEMFS